jgi:hypothetical protein
MLERIRDLEARVRSLEENHQAGEALRRRSPWESPLEAPPGRGIQQMETKLASFPSQSLPSDDQWTLNDKSANFSSHQRFPGIPAHRMPFPAPAPPLSS